MGVQVPPRPLFGVGLIGAALLAASILPLSTADSVSEFVGRESALDDRPREAPLFYGTYAVIVTVGAALILVPGAPLVSILVLTQILNAVLLLPLLAFMYGIARNRTLMGDHVAGKTAVAGYLIAIAFIAICVGSSPCCRSPEHVGTWSRFTRTTIEDRL